MTHLLMPEDLNMLDDIRRAHARRVYNERWTRRAQWLRDSGFLLECHGWFYLLPKGNRYLEAISGRTEVRSPPKGVTMPTLKLTQSGAARIPNGAPGMELQIEKFTRDGEAVNTHVQHNGAIYELHPGDFEFVTHWRGLIPIGGS